MNMRGHADMKFETVIPNMIEKKTTETMFEVRVRNVTLDLKKSILKVL